VHSQALLLTSIALAGPSYFFVSVGDHIRVNLAAKKSLVIIGGSQNLQFLNDPVRFPALGLRKVLLHSLAAP
jgi:hypothetical protein